ncbi:putative holin-like toxin [Paenibacillus tarimensis]
MACRGGRLISRKGGEAMEVYQALTLMISFATLVVLILSFDKKK